MKALNDWWMEFGWLAMNFEKIQEIDVNPLLIVDGEPVAVDATIIFKKKPTGKQPDLSTSFLLM
jgi:hypothetical protein